MHCKASEVESYMRREMIPQPLTQGHKVLLVNHPMVVYAHHFEDHINLLITSSCSTKFNPKFRDAGSSCLKSVRMAETTKCMSCSSTAQVVLFPSPGEHGNSMLDPRFSLELALGTKFERQ